jgi:hypothetical protein
MVFIPESEVFFVCSAIVFKAFQRGATKYFLTRTKQGKQGQGRQVTNENTQKTKTVNE